ncbi:hypothetical protein BKA82DRAFT_33136 [Pisolithus tinctorius]|nr:hypothetical protein BKA82DRAFT_33136 [Pisolithus tinctorius]
MSEGVLAHETCNTASLRNLYSYRDVPYTDQKPSLGSTMSLKNKRPGGETDEIHEQCPEEGSPPNNKGRSRWHGIAETAEGNTQNATQKKRSASTHEMKNIFTVSAATTSTIWCLNTLTGWYTAPKDARDPEINGRDFAFIVWLNGGRETVDRQQRSKWHEIGSEKSGARAETREMRLQDPGEPWDTVRRLLDGHGERGITEIGWPDPELRAKRPRCPPNMKTGNISAMAARN